VPRIPVACLLEASEREDRLAAWTALIRTACLELEPMADGVRGRFTPGAKGELERLVAGERMCCGWAEWTVSHAGDEVVLVAKAVNEPGPEVLRRLFHL
jgi:hypothetical protein